MGHGREKNKQNISRAHQKITRAHLKLSGSHLKVSCTNLKLSGAHIKLPTRTISGVHQKVLVAPSVLLRKMTVQELMCVYFNLGLHYKDIVVLPPRWLAWLCYIQKKPEHPEVFGAYMKVSGAHLKCFSSLSLSLSSMSLKRLRSFVSYVVVFFFLQPIRYVDLIAIATR